MSIDKAQIVRCLKHMADMPLHDSALQLWKVLGYSSIRQPEDYELSFDQFQQSYAQDKSLREGKARHDEWDKLYLLFQVTDDELKNHFEEPVQVDIFGNGKAPFEPFMNSYLFAALNLKGSSYSKTALADIARQINRCFAIPLIISFKYGDLLTIAVVNRREHKRDNNRDVLEKVILIKDIHLSHPHRAHIDILSELSIETLSAKYALRNFDDLHKAWAKTLDLSELNKRFYTELSNWYFWAIQNVQFPAGEESNPEIRNSISVIRLITRMIFVWFMKEKSLISDTLFDAAKIPQIIHFSDANESSYYKAILQNLFFATLNTEMSHEAELPRRFREKIIGNYNRSFNIHSLFRYEKLFKNPKTAIDEYFGNIPFLNGGLFECLDREIKGNDKTIQIRIDGFSDREDNVLKVPDYLFLNPDETEIDLNGIYGTKEKRYKVRGLLSILHSYKFTVSENTPVEEEVALDPELLGRVFENLLAAYNPETKATARHETGSFYTPREIVEFMVNESLLAHLSKALCVEDPTQKADIELRLGLLISYTDEEHLFSDAEASKLINAIDDLKAIDPACGSGAFLMGLLLKMVYILHKLDPNNEKWKAKQISNIKEQIDKIHIYTDKDLQTKIIAKLQESIADIENTFEDYDFDYSRKLFLIERCIYGSDIQPIAIQIAKLRFFISLLVDQQVKSGRSNLGIRALPNLETNLVAADSLIPLNLEDQMDYFFDKEIEDFKKYIKRIHNEYFTARTRKHKQDIRHREKCLRNDFAAKLIQEQVPVFKAELIANWNPYASNDYAKFFDPGIMFGLDSLNMVITNPPYIRQEDIPNKAALREAGYKVFNATSDIYTYFYELAFWLLEPGGIAAFITSNKWMRSKYGTKLRDILGSSSKLHAIIDFGGYQVFESATVDTNIIIFENNLPAADHMLPFVNVSKAFDGNNLSKYFYEHKGDIPQSSFKINGWTLADFQVLSLKNKIESIGKPLKDWDVNIYYGIKTGCNEAFIIDTPTKERLCAEDPKSARIIKPILRGRDISRYRYQWAGLWVISTFPALDLNIDDYPAIKAYLAGFGKKLEQSGKSGCRKKTNNKWFETQDTIAYYREFEKEKIVYPNMTKYLPFMLDTKQFYTNQKCFILTRTTGSLFPLLGLLNSKLIYFYIKSTFPELLGGTRELNKDRFELLPVCSLIVDNHQLADLVSKIIVINETVSDSCSLIENKDYQFILSQINQIVYQLYNLTPEEIALIESMTKDA